MQPPPVTRASDDSLPAVRVAGSVRASARLTQTTEVISALPISDVGEVVIREASAEPRRALRPVDLSVPALGSTAWGRRVLLQGLALAALVLLLTAAPLLAWEVRLYGTSALSSLARAAACRRGRPPCGGDRRVAHRADYGPGSLLPGEVKLRAPAGDLSRAAASPLHRARRSAAQDRPRRNRTTSCWTIPTRSCRASTPRCGANRRDTCWSI